MFARRILRTLAVCCVGAAVCANASAEPPAGAGAARSFLAAKTLFQTNVGYDPRIAIAVDGVIVHRHGADLASLRRDIDSWRRHGALVGRMFFADSDATNEYWTGKWDDTPHPDDVERDARGELVKCEGVRPYMLPTDGWTRYLEEMAARSIDAGADAILPEEPLAHVFTGYEKAFQALWVKRYGRPWQPESASSEARYLTAQLKNELYLELERRLAEVTEERARRQKRDIAFVMPVHSLYSNVAAQLVAPLGTSAGAREIDGYIGQVWTGPVNSALANYDSADKTFFDSAYVLYDYFVELAAGSGKRMWLLADPVEDDPRHEWREFETWYRHCVAAKLLFPEVDAYEVMPWPDRIFLPGYATGGGTPGPERFRIVLLSAIQVLQEVPVGGSWCADSADRGGGSTEGVGVAMADTLMWQPQRGPMLQGVYGLMLPLVHAGVPAAACVLERSGDAAYMSRFRTIVLSYEDLKPLDAKMNAAVAQWVKGGGSLIILGAADDLGGAAMWWKKAGFASPVHHLLAQLGIRADADGEWKAGRGWVARRTLSSRKFGDPAVARAEYLPLVDAALRRAGLARGLATPGSFCMRRGPFVIAHATRTPLSIPGKLIDVFDPELPVLDGVKVAPGMSGIYRDVTSALDSAADGRSRPRVLHCTHRLTAEEYKAGVLRFTIRGPAETPAVARVLTDGAAPKGLTARDAAGKTVAVDSRPDGPTQRLRFANHPDGVTVEVVMP
ncbi:MAG: hypothetical protein ACPMAQ_09635 [Phycisphaerae bacterium]